MLRTVVILALILLTREAGLFGQQHPPDSAEARPVRRWSLVASSVGHSGGPVADFEKGMVAAGLDQDSECWIFCTGTISHPSSHKGPLGSSIALSYAYRPTMSLRLFWSTLDLGETLGYREPLMHLFLRGEVQTASLVASLTPERATMV